MKEIKCVKCGQLAAFPTAVKEPYTCLTCQTPEQPATPETGGTKAVGSSALLARAEAECAELQQDIYDLARDFDNPDMRQIASTLRVAAATVERACDYLKERIQRANEKAH